WETALSTPQRVLRRANLRPRSGPRAHRAKAKSAAAAKGNEPPQWEQRGKAEDRKHSTRGCGKRGDATRRCKHHPHKGRDRGPTANRRSVADHPCEARLSIG